jgi:hypothetical protein
MTERTRRVQVQVDAEDLPRLDAIATRLAAELGAPVTRTQALRAIIRRLAAPEAQEGAVTAERAA